MTVLDVKTLKPTANEVLLDAIRNDASPDYIARIPSATQAGIQATLAALQTYRPQQNEFIDALVNKVALSILRSHSWTNPLAEFKRGLLTGGDTIEEIMVGLIKAKTYDPSRDALEQELFGTAPIEVQTNYHRVNRRDKYKVTVNQPLLMNAFNQPQGLSNFASQIMAAPGTSDQWDEFLTMCRLFAEYERNGGYHKVKIRDITNPDSPTLAADTKSVLTRIRSMAGTLKFISTAYNAARMPVSARPDELILFVTPDFNAVLDVEALAAAFNIDRALVPSRIIEIPKEQFGIDNVEAILTTKDFFVVADQLFETASQWNPASLQNNYWLHRWQVISASRFVPAIAFTVDEGDEIIKLNPPVTALEAITVTATDGSTVTGVLRGERYQVNTATVTDGNSDGIRYYLTGNTSPRTYISQTGVLTVGGDEGGTLTVNAVSTWLDPENIMRDGARQSVTLAVTGTVVLDAWPAVDNPDTAVDDASNVVTGITIQGVAVSPTFDPGVFTYTANVADLPVDEDDIVVTADGIDQGDIQVTVDGNTVTVEAAGAAGEPVYTVTVS
ncbi:major capsid protein [Arthrobacter phage Tillums]|nr:major capsid protein [Arthrobacter phage Tillums]